MQNVVCGLPYITAEAHTRRFAFLHFHTFAFSYFCVFAFSHFRIFAFSHFHTFSFLHFHINFFALLHFCGCLTEKVSLLICLNIMFHHKEKYLLSSFDLSTYVKRAQKTPFGCQFTTYKLLDTNIGSMFEYFKCLLDIELAST